MTPPIALFLCNRTPTMYAPWLSAGVECWSIDLQNPPGEHRTGNLVTVGADVLTWLPPRRSYLFACAFTDCTNMSVSGARWFKEKGLTAIAKSLTLAARCAEILEWCECPWFVENPVSTLATYWRAPDYSFNPCDFGDPYTKRTCLWTGGGFVMPEIIRPGEIELWRVAPTAVAPTLGSKMHLMPPSDDRKNLRSETPAGFARAVFRTNYKGNLHVDQHVSGPSSGNVSNKGPLGRNAGASVDVGAIADGSAGYTQKVSGGQAVDGNDFGMPGPDPGRGVVARSTCATSPSPPLLPPVPGQRRQRVRCAGDFEGEKTMSETQRKISELARAAMEKLYADMRERGNTTTMMFDFGVPAIAAEFTPFIESAEQQSRDHQTARVAAEERAEKAEAGWERSDAERREILRHFDEIRNSFDTHDWSGGNAPEVVKRIKRTIAGRDRLAAENAKLREEISSIVANIDAAKDVCLFNREVAADGLRKAFDAADASMRESLGFVSGELKKLIAPSPQEGTPHV